MEGAVRSGDGLTAFSGEKEGRFVFLHKLKRHEENEQEGYDEFEGFEEEEEEAPKPGKGRKDKIEADEDASGVYAIFLRPGEKISLWGDMLVSLVAGEANITGADLVGGDDGEHLVKYAVRAPMSHSPVTIVCPPHSRTSSPWRKMFDRHFADVNHAALSSFVKASKSFGCILRIARSRSSWRPHPELLFPKWCQLNSQFGEAFPLSWRKGLQNQLENTEEGRPLTLAICGAKKVGKSTFARFCINSILSRGFSEVILVDLDMSMPEAGCPGTVSCWTTQSVLLSPGYCSPLRSLLRPLKTVLVAGYSLEEDPVRYKQAVLRVAQRVALYRERAGPIPVVISTYGWLAGEGLQVNRFVLDVFRPTSIFHLRDPANETISAKLLVEAASSVDAALFPLPFVVAGNKPAEFEAPNTNFVREIAVGRAIGHYAIQVPLADVCIAIHRGGDVGEEHVLRCLSNTLVALAYSSSPNAEERKGMFLDFLPPQSDSGEGKKKKRRKANDAEEHEVDSDEDEEVLALGLVRGLSADKKSLVIQCSLDPKTDQDTISHINLIERAMHELPAKSKYGPYGSKVRAKGLGNTEMLGDKFVMREQHN